MAMQLTHAGAKPPTSLLSLPDELIGRIFTENYLGRTQASGKKPRVCFPIICKRLTALLERLWSRTIYSRTSHDDMMKLLANVLTSRPSKRAAVRDVEICVRPGSPLLVYAALAHLPGLQSLRLHLVDDDDVELWGSAMGSIESARGVQRVFEHCVNLRRLQVIAQSLPIDFCRLRLPTTINHIVLDAGAFDAPTAENLQQADIKILELRFLSETDTDLAVLPWKSLQELTLTFFLHDENAIKACILSLADQSFDGSKAASLQALNININGDFPVSDETIIDTLRRAFEHCEVTTLALESAGHDLDLQLDEEWPSLNHLRLSIWPHEFMPHRLEHLDHLLQQFDNLVSLTIGDMDFSSCECCAFNLDDFIEYDEDNWAPEGRNLIATVHLVRHQTQIRDLRIQGSDRRRELRWTRTSAADDFALERWTLF